MTLGWDANVLKAAICTGIITNYWVSGELGIQSVETNSAQCSVKCFKNQGISHRQDPIYTDIRLATSDLPFIPCYKSPLDVVGFSAFLHFCCVLGYLVV